jgi:putative membrane-bound dehydrogenase-like protein
VALALTLLFGTPRLVHAQVPPEKAGATFTVADGLEFKLWASEPLFVNPTCMDIDHKGRVWVCESVNYRNKLHHRKTLNRPEGDRIVILEDTKGTGKADKATTFYQSPEMLAPLGIAVAKDPVGPGYKVFVCQSPDILVFEDKDGDGKADGPPKKLLSGFGGYDHDHGVHGILIGPDMKLYFSVGDQGVRDLQSSDGKGRKWTSNATDCRAGTIWRCDLDGKNLELIAHNFRNEYEPCVDSFGTVFVSDNDDDGNQQTRICYVMPGGNYGYHPRGPGQTHWHEEQPGVVPKILRTYFGSPTGMCVYEGTLLPKKYWGQPLHTDAGPRHVRCYHLKPQGAGYEVDREDMVTSTDNWFRPSDVCVAPDGSVFVCDWYDPGVGGHGMGDTTRGRVYRLAPKGHNYQVPKVDLESKEGILAALGSPNLAVRYMAMAKLQQIKPEVVFDSLPDALASQRENPWLMARFMWQFVALMKRMGMTANGKIGPATVRGSDESFQLLGMRAAKQVFNLPTALTPEVRRGSPAVRREALLLLRDVDPAKAKSPILELAKFYDGKDRFYLEAIGIAVGHHDKARREAILADFPNQFPEWNDKVADLVWELQPPAMLPTLGTKLADTKLTPEQRGRIIDILATSDDPGAGKALLGVLARGDTPAAVKAKAVENLRLFLPGKWQGLRQSAELGEAVRGLLANDATRPTALALIGAADRGDMAAAVVELARRRDEPAAVRKAAVQTLGQVGAAPAVTTLRDLLEDRGLGSEALASLGRLVQQRPGRPGVSDALNVLQDVVTSKDRPAELRRGAVEALSGSRTGTIWLLALHAKGELDPALMADTSRLLRNSPHQDLRNKAMVAFPPPGRLDMKKLPAPAALAARRGDAARGQKLLAASAKSDLQCLKCHSVLGSGGAIGPDLSVIGKKASRENLFESILLPSKAIADQYVVWQVETKKGAVLSGLLVEEAPDHLVLRDANGKDTRVDAKEVESREKGAKSLMPEDLAAYMTEDDLIDLVEYLFTLKSPALGMDYWHVAGPFANGDGDTGLDAVLPPEKGIDLKATYKGKSGPVTWRTVRPDAQGYVDLQAFFAPDSDNIVSCLTRVVDSPADQDVTILLGADDASKLWVNDTLVHTARDHNAATPGMYTVKAKLRRGPNRILLKITNGDGAHGFYFTLLAEEEVKRIEEK